MSKIFVLDTSVLLSVGRRALHQFKDSTVVLPLVVVTELEGKRNHPELGYTARSVLRDLDSIRETGNIREGVEVGGVTVRVEMNHIAHPKVLDLRSDRPNDLRIISVAKSLSENHPEDEVVLLSKDIPLKILADLVGVVSRDISHDPESRKFIDEVPELTVSADEIDTLFSQGSVRLDLDVPINCGVILKSFDGKSALALAKGQFNFELVKSKNTKFYGLEGKSAPQHIALSQLTDETIRAVSLGGKAGTGKTVMALAAGVHAIETQGYKKVVVFRSMHSVGGEDLGFLPGTENEKMSPWTKAVFDALSALDIKEPHLRQMISGGKIEVLPITHIRGRTFNNTYIIVDESQNLHKDTLMTILTRAGKGSKVVMTHDISQRDNLRVSKYEGIYQVVSKLHDNKLFAHTTLTKSERSELAQFAAEALDF